MKITITMPKLGEGMTEGTIAKWLKAAGAVVTKGEPIAEIETEKAVQDLEAPASGALTEILVPEGSQVEVERPIAIIDVAE
jgi:pyruvate/2-oxoglutarate dehydrogenase complex dihydrolipoamide acyltransferase (E2) component